MMEHKIPSLFSLVSLIRGTLFLIVIKNFYAKNVIFILLDFTRINAFD